MNAIYHDVFIKSEPSKIYDAISTSQGLNNWWTLKSSGFSRVGEVYNFYFTPEYDWYGEVINADKDVSFYIKMTQADEDWIPTAFGFDFMKVQGGTRIQFWHKGWPECNHHFRRSSWCWAMLLNGLKNYVEKGIVVPFEDRE
ncbi:MAG: SRPBCC domain-containing protein [Saprospiraceae bacterium]|nr:SRPBCC domain-containing protein [Saprospiraceae bacterium]